MTVLFLSDNFPPEYNAPASRTYEHCLEWVRAGHTVTVITCFPNFPKGSVFPGYTNKLYQKEVIDGIKVIRVWSFIAPNKGTFKRTIDYVSYAAMSFFAGLFVRCDVIIATSPQFFTAISGCSLSIVRRKKWIMEVRDIWPESISAVEAMSSKKMLRLLEKIELFLYKKAAHIIVVTDSFKANLTSRGVPSSKISVVKNGVNLSGYKLLVAPEILRGKLGLNDKFIVGYIGTHGLAHSLDFILSSISKLRDPNIHFLFVGDGAVKADLKKTATLLKLSNITFLDPIKKEEVPEYLQILDCALVPLKKSSTFEGVIPSKIFETAAAGIPMLIGVDGEARSIVEKYNAGVFFEPENETDFIDKLLLLKHETINNQNFKMGCEKLAMDFDRKNLALSMLATVQQVIN